MMSDQDLVQKGREIMEVLYGKSAQAVIDRIHEVDDFFGEWVLKYTYGVAWADPILSFKEKSIVVITSLAVSCDEERLSIHLMGFFNLGGTLAELQAIFAYLFSEKNIDNRVYTNAEKVLENFCLERKLSYAQHSTQQEQKEVALSDLFGGPRTKAVVDLAASVALKHEEKLSNIFNTLKQKEPVLNEGEMRSVIRLQMTYCGCPASMSALDQLTQSH